MRHLILLALCSLPLFAHAEEQVRSTPAYDSINVRGPFDLEIVAGKDHSLKLSGDPRLFDRIKTDVVDGRLNITFKTENKNVGIKDLPHIRLTLPTLRNLTEEGAGQTVLTDIDSKRLDINYKGAGRLAASGRVQDLRLEARGVGEVDAKGLIAQDANVDFEGVGDVKIYASHRLDLLVNGMGDLTYYGKPRVVNKTASGFGNITAGD
ncbi:MAG TPA: head GIN domain-containing protein [Burkholderiaceae bacterium]